MVWTNEKFQRAFSHIPRLANADVTNALRAAGKSLKPEATRQLREQLGVALRNYIVERVFEIATKAVTPSAEAKRLDKIAKNARRLYSSIGEPRDATGEVAYREIRRQARGRSKQLAELFNLRAIEWTATDAGKPVHVLDDQEDVSLRKIVEGIAELEWLASAATRRRRAKVAKTAGNRARHKGDKAIQSLFGTLNGIWFDFFDEVPTTSYNPYSDDPVGPYIDFVHTVLHRYSSSIPNELELVDRGLRARLRLTRNAIQMRFRDTKLSKLNRVVRSISESN
jgi:hypothetical protein